MSQVSHYFSRMMSQIHQMEMTHWIIVAVVLVGVGVFCMRGFGANRI